MNNILDINLVTTLSNYPIKQPPWSVKRWITLFVFSLYLSLTIGCSEKIELKIEGKILAENGQPLSGARVVISGPESHVMTSGSNGKFLFGDIVAGSYQITVTKPDYQAYINQITVIDTASTTNVILEKQNSQTIFGIVTNQDSQQLLSNVKLTTIPPTSEVISDSDGNYRFYQKLQPDSYVVRAEAEGFEITQLDVVVRLGEPARADILLPPLKPVLSFSKTSLDFGTHKDNLKLTIKNEGKGSLNWTVDRPKEPWIKLGKLKGTAKPEMPDTISIEVKRDGLEPKAYQLELTFTHNGSIKRFPITVNVKPKPALFVSPEKLDFGSDQQSLTISIENRGTGPLEWTITSPEKWIRAEPTSGQTRQTSTLVKLTVDRQEMRPGDYQQQLTVVSNGGQMDVGASIRVNANPRFHVNTKALDFGNSTKNLSLTIRNLGTGQLDWQISVPETEWLKIVPQNGISSRQASSVINLNVVRMGLAAKQYRQVITITSGGGDWPVEVSMLVDRSTLLVNKPKLSLMAKEKEQSFQLSRQGFSNVDFEIYSSQKWLQIEPQRGQLNDQSIMVQVKVDRSPLPLGNGQAVLTIESNQIDKRLELTVMVEVLPTLELKVIDAKTRQPISQAKALSREAQVDGRIRFKDTDLDMISGLVSAEGYLNQSFSVSLRSAKNRLVEEIIPLTPIPQPAGRIQGRELDLPTEIISSSDGIFAYVINSESSTVNQITISSNEIVKTFDLSSDGRNPKDLIAHPLTGQVIVANSFVKPVKLGTPQNDTISIMPELLDRSVVLAVGNHPVGLAIDPTTNRLYVANQSSRTISVVDLGQQKEIGLLIPLRSGIPNRMVLTNGYLYAIVGETIEIFDTRSNRSVKSINSVFGPLDLAASSNQKFVYVVNNKRNSLSIIDTINQVVIKEVPVGSSPVRVALSKGFHPNRDLIFVVNQGDFTVTMLETRANEVSPFEVWQAEVAAEPIKVGFMPLGVCVTTDKVYIVRKEDSVIEVLEF